MTLSDTIKKELREEFEKVIENSTNYYMGVDVHWHDFLEEENQNKYHDEEVNKMLEFQDQTVDKVIERVKKDAKDHLKISETIEIETFWTNVLVWLNLLTEKKN